MVILIPDQYHDGVAMTLRTDEELQAALRALSEEEGVSQQEIIRRAVLDRAARSRHRTKVSAASERSLGRWGDVLDRLGDS